MEQRLPLLEQQNFPHQIISHATEGAQARQALLFPVPTWFDEEKCHAQPRWEPGRADRSTAGMGEGGDQGLRRRERDQLHVKLEGRVRHGTNSFNF